MVDVGANYGYFALLWASLHGYVTLRASSPGFPWFADEEHVCRALIARATASTR